MVIIAPSILRKTMRIIFVTLFSFISLFALGEEINTMQADFVQTITDEKNSTISYQGDMLAKRPNLARWHYDRPIEKTVYITTAQVTIIEPELEQAIIKHLNNSIDILAILASAQKKDHDHYIAYYDDKEYHITLDKKQITSLYYWDAFDNRVEITFTDQKINSSIDDSQFQAEIPPDYDIIED